jgi:uncharacterized protein (UPF0332 family)
MVKRLSELDECFKKGLMRKIPASEEKALKSMAKANKWLIEAKKNLEHDLLDSCLVSSYSAMFHAARALLFKDGFREKSHYCVVRYLEEKYVEKGKLPKLVVDLLDRLRDLRHTDLYQLDFFVTKEEAKEAIKSAEIVIREVAKLIEK